MRFGALWGAALIGAGSPATPVAAAQDCAAIIDSLDGLSARILSQSDDYWARRKSYLEQRSSERAGGAAASQSAQSALLSQQQANAIKADMPKNLASFAAQISVATAQKCLTPELLKELREKTFKAARTVNFDELPTGESMEGIPAAKQSRRMPEK